MNFRSIGSKISSVIFSAVMVGQAFSPCVSAVGGWTELHERLKNGVNMTVFDVRDIVAKDPSCAKQVYTNSSGEHYSAAWFALYRGENSDENRVAIAEYLIEQGAPTSSEYNAGIPLFLFNDRCFHDWLWGRQDIYNIDFHDRDRSTGKTFMHVLAEENNAKLLKSVNARFPELATVCDCSGNSILHTAAAEDSCDAAEFILNEMREVDPNGVNDEGDTVLRIAQKFGSVLVENVLLKSRRVKAQPASAAAVSSARPSTTVTARRNKSSSPKSPEKTFEDLRSAQRLCDLGKFRAAMTAQIKSGGIEYKDAENGETILHLAIRELVSVDRIRILLKEGHANPNCVDNDGDTPLIALAKCAKESSAEMVCELIDLLIQFGADPTIANNDGKNALNYCSGCAKEVKDKFKERGCPPAVHGKFGTAIRALLGIR